MIVGTLHPGSGVGDQLFCYLAARITAERLGVPFGMAGEFKGKDFIQLERGVEIPFPYRVELPAGKIIVDAPFALYEGKPDFDPEFFFLSDNTIVDGCRLQDEKYWDDADLFSWLKTEPIGVPDDLCIIGFRGGEYAAVPELFLTKDYWEAATNKMREINPAMRFRVVTDDPGLARVCLPHYEITHDVSQDWRQIRYARYAIIANSAFYILPRLLKHYELEGWDEDTVTVAPRYWARRNIEQWSTSQNFYKSFIYL